MTFQELTSGYARDKHNPTTKKFVALTLEELKNLKSNTTATISYGIKEKQWVLVKITSVKTFAQLDRVRIGWKYGLKEFGKLDIVAEQTAGVQIVREVA